MAFDLEATVLGFIAAYGLIAIFILLVMDGAMMLPVFPGELIMVLAVIQFADSWSDLLLLIVLATTAGIVGSLILYGFARSGGRRLIEKHPRMFMMSRRRRERLERAFQRPVGQSLVMFLRLIPLTRVIVNLPAGLARMPLGRFLVLSAIGMAVFHAGFLWLAYEFRRPESAVATQASAFSDAYGSTAWEYVQANAILTGAAVVVLGVMLSLRATRRMHRDPEESTGSLIGTLATMVLFWGGLALGALLWLEPLILFELAQLGGIQQAWLNPGRLPYEPHSVVGAVAGAMVLLALMLRSLRKAAKRRQAHHMAKLEARAQAMQARSVAAREVRYEEAIFVETAEAAPSPPRPQRSARGRAAASATDET